ncbi:hypothetical protein Y032_0151g2838 [Ancylostoma ceylanicum]|nr:hypothetical protein Y032_0151g2838 [Ancylostoma ceylanicum]
MVLREGIEEHDEIQAKFHNDYPHVGCGWLMPNKITSKSIGTSYVAMDFRGWEFFGFQMKPEWIRNGTNIIQNTYSLGIHEKSASKILSK